MDTKHINVVKIKQIEKLKKIPAIPGFAYFLLWYSVQFYLVSP